MRFRIEFEYEVEVPDVGTVAFNNLVEEYKEDNGTVPSEDDLAYFVLEKSYGGDHTDKVALVFDQSDIVKE